MTLRARIAAGLVALGLLAAACSSTPFPPRAGAPPASAQTFPAVPTGKGSAAAALSKLCPHVSASPVSGTSPEGSTPPAIAQVEREVEQVRGLKFTKRIPVDPVTHAKLVRLLSESFNQSFPGAQYARRSLAWQTIGAIPPGTRIRRALLKFQSGQVIGFYDPTSGQLVFIGTSNPSPLQRITLAHELTHAIDDQHFGLKRIDALGNRCQDEAQTAAIGTVEGSAQFFSLQVATRFLTPQEQLGLLNVRAPSIAGIPPFIVQMELWPYTAGLAFITALDVQGGLPAVNRALMNFPTSTEQIIHPELYPNDVPEAVNVPDLGPKLGKGWRDLDVEQVGEEWLLILLGLRLEQQTAASAAAGWGGGLYRAWSKGDHVAVVLSTVWDTTNDAAEFADAMRRWLDAGSGQQAFVLPPSGSRVRVGFASDASTLAALRAAM